MRRQQKIIILGGIVGVVLGIILGVVVARRYTREEGAVGRTDGKKLLKVGMSLLGLVRLIQEL
ncbi:MAG: hypothetical protein GXY68_04710 [Chloroflexi bacterium]|nr:hypothetical protein [Chloroflexota bacterium]